MEVQNSLLLFVCTCTGVWFSAQIVAPVLSSVVERVILPSGRGLDRGDVACGPSLFDPTVL